jgi:hypothetical protein
MKKNVKRNAGMFLLMMSLCGAGTVFAQTANLLVCSDKGFTLTNAAAASDGSATYKWYENVNSGGFTEVGGETGTSLHRDAKATGTYQYVRVASSQGCADVPSNTYTVKVVAAAVVPTIPTPDAVCEGNDVIFAVTSPQSGATFSWTGTAGTEGGTGDATYTITAPLATGTINVQATASIYHAVDALTKTCVSLPASNLTATVNPLPVVTPDVSEYDVCGAGLKDLKVTVTAGGADVTNFSTITWYSDASGNTVVNGSGGANYEVNVTTTTTYYVKAEVIATECEAASLTEVIATISLNQGAIDGASD